MALTGDQAAAVLARLYSRLTARRAEIDELEAYYRGEHPLRFATPEWRADHERRYEGFSDNWCGVVGSAPGERTDVLGFRIGDDIGVLDDAERQLRRDWDANDMPAQASQGFITSTIAKRSFVSVWGDADDAPVMKWEHPSQVLVDYDEMTRARRYAIKAWSEDTREYATLYTPDGVWKFQAAGVGEDTAARVSATYGFVLPRAVGSRSWVPRLDLADGEVWPLPNPLGVVPVVEFPNRPMLRGEPISDIAGTKSMQDAINMMWAYLLVASDFASLPQRVVMGQAPPKIPILNDEGQVIGEQPVELEDLRRGRFLWLTGQHASIGEYKSASSDFFLNVVNVLTRHISAQTKTPIYLIHGELGNVNGETISAMDQPLNAKVREAHKFYTPAVREVHRLAALVRGGTDAKAIAQACRYGVVQWANPEVRSDAQRSDAALKDQQIGLPLEMILADRYGKSQAEIARIMGLVDERDARQVAGLLREVRQPEATPAAIEAPAPVS